MCDTLIFFFSSRRRHTRFDCDWSSDVCSSDLPQTAFLFLINDVAISALPPLNGFVSEWLTYQALLQGFGTTPSLWRLVFPLGGAMLALTGALAAACFVKAFGIAFLAQPRSEHAARAHETALSMRCGLAVLAAACVAPRRFPTAS